MAAKDTAPPAPPPGGEYRALLMAIATVNGHPDPEGYVLRVDEVLNGAPESPADTAGAE